jgi:O-acetylhomoserine (thiol)-lyase
MKGFTTRAIHSPYPKKDPHGALRMPVYEGVTFEFEKSIDIQLAFEGKKPAHAYSRISNPTVEDFELRVRAVSDAQGVIAVSSGMAAISSVILALAEAGTNIITTKFLFGNTYSFFNHTLKPWGLGIKYADMSDPESVARAIDSQTRAIFVETITNPQLQVADFRALAEIGRKRGVPLIIDGTLTTPYLFKSKDSGVAVEVISSTKYMSGGATSVGGIIIDNGTFDWKQSPRLKTAAAKAGPFALIYHLRREVYRNLGCCLSPHNAFLQTLGLETMAMRIEKSCANALALARFLASSPKVKSVNYPGLESSPAHALAKTQFQNRFGGLLTLTLDNKVACYRLMDALSVVRRATNINDNKTLILHPASTIFCEYGDPEKAEMGVSDSLLRLTLGIEDSEDLIEDFQKGLESI